MNRRLLGVFAFALVVAGVTSFAVYRLLVSHVPQVVPRPMVRSKLVVASHDLQVGALIQDYDLKEIVWTGQPPEHVVKSHPDLVGRGVVATIYEGEPLVEGRLAPKGAGAGLAATIPIGMRAVAIPVNEVVGLAGFVLPGMRVDVLVAGNAGGGDAGTVCRTILQNIEVLSAGQKIEKRVDGKPESAQVVNLLVTPNQAEILNLASGQAKVQLVLRNPLDTKQEPTRGSSLAMLFGFEKRPAAPPVTVARATDRPAREPEVATVEVFSGVKRSEQKIDIPQ
jgi:pilus assembly protein CpaB